MIPMRLRPFLAAIGLGAVLMASAFLSASCSTTKGNLYRSSVSSDAAAAEEAKRRTEEKRRAAAAASPSVPTSPGRPPASTPPPPSPSPQPVSPSTAPGLSANDLAVRFLADAIRAATSGHLSLGGLPDGARVFIDGQLQMSGPSGAAGPGAAGLGAAGPIGSAGGVALGKGLHSVRVEAFGYLPWTKAFSIDILRLTTLEVDMSPAPFSLGAVTATPGSFDPSSPARLGETEISFTASAPGTASIELRDRTGRVVLEKGNLRIWGPRTVVPWNGRGRDGQALPAGEYRMVVSATSFAGSRLEAQGFVKLSDNHVSTSYSSLAGGFSGSVYAPDARILPASRAEATLGMYAVLDRSAALAARLPGFTGIRFGLPGNATEISASAMGVFYPGYNYATSPDSWSIAVSVKTSLHADDTFGLALLMGGSFGSFFAVEAPASWDGPARFPGVNAGLVVESDSGLARVYASLQLAASGYYPNYGADPAVPGFYLWSYLRSGIEFPLPDFLRGQATLSLSAAGRTTPFNEGFAFGLPLSIGAELHWYKPHSPTVFSFYGSGEWASEGNFYFGGGLGIGVLY